MKPEAATEPQTRPSIYLLLTFWGDEFLDHTCRLTLPSLLSPNNIPAIKNKKCARFLIATTKADWGKLEQQPIFQLLKQQIQVEFLPNEDDPEFPLHKYVRMSKGHADLAERCFRDKAIAINVNPDSIYPDGCIAEAQRLAEQGTHVALCAAVRFDMEGVVRALKKRGLLDTGKPYTLPMREAVDIGLHNFHPETKASRWGAMNFGRLHKAHNRYHFLTCCYWEVPGEDGCLIITHNWSPFMVDYSVLGSHDVKALDGRALDGNYIFENFPYYTDSIKVVTDSDQVFLLGLTPHDDMLPPADWLWWRNLPFLREWSMGYILNRTVFDRGIDIYRRRIYLNPVRFHAGDLNRHWNPTEDKVTHLIEDYVSRDLHDYNVMRARLGRPQRLWTRLIRHINETQSARLSAPSVATGEVHGENEVVATLTKVLPGNVATAKRSDGVSFLGFSFVPKTADSEVFVHVVATASAEAAIDFVVAVFRSDRQHPVFLEKRKIPAGERVTIDETFTLVAETAVPFALDFRIGPGCPGTIVFNGPEGGPPLRQRTSAMARELGPHHAKKIDATHPQPQK